MGRVWRLWLLLQLWAGLALTQQKIGGYVIPNITNPMYVDVCANTPLAYDQSTDPVLTNPSSNFFSDLVSALSEQSTEFVRLGKYVSIPQNRPLSSGFENAVRAGNK